jgi:4-alpha-glucanotransferase
VPPDYFSADGQLWGNPLYRWDRHKETGFKWWIGRLKACAARFDALRLDHFIGFRNYWEIPAGEKTAINGRWVQAPGDEFFETVLEAVPGLEIVAEDLGVATPAVIALRDKFKLPGMRLAQFSFGGEAKDYPSEWPENCVGYTGTHDNDTTRGWWEDDGTVNAQRSAADAEKERAGFKKALGRETERPAWDMTAMVWASPARTAIVPLQDLLNAPSSARMNKPGTTDGNWRWRMEPGSLTADLAGRLGVLTGASGRAPK